MVIGKLAPVTGTALAFLPGCTMTGAINKLPPSVSLIHAPFPVFYIM